jgi:diguanylate cyclase (GGDEF)-like protein
MFVRRKRRWVVDGLTTLMVLLTCLYLAVEYDFFKEAGSSTSQQKTIELDEALLIGAVMALLLLALSVRHYKLLKQETQRRITAEQHIRVLAFQDSLTGLANRRRFDDELRAAAASPPADNAVHAIYLLDLNGFKRINDNYGHATGDEVLTVAAQRLLCSVRDGDLVARLGGDEFAVLAQHVLGAEEATSIALRLVSAFEEPINLADVQHTVCTGVGISLMPRDATEPEELLRRADVALYRAKEERRCAIRFFEPAMDLHVQERHWLQSELRTAIEAGQIHASFLPSVELETNVIIGFEAVPVWIHPEAGDILPARVLPVAEECGLIHILAERLLAESCRAALRWPENVVLSIDLLSAQLKDEQLHDRILRILRETGLAPNRLELEISESALVRNLDAAQSLLGSLRDAGVRLALDHFGTGYSSLYHLRNFKLDKIKIDSSFIRTMLQQKESAEVVRALVGLAHGLGLTIAADGIQSPNQQTSLLSTGCQQGQGSLYSKPIPAEATGKLFPNATSAPAATANDRVILTCVTKELQECEP